MSIPIPDHIWRSANWRQVPLWLWGLLVISFCTNAYPGLLWIEWNSAITPQDAIRQSPDLAAQINPNWKAVTINHGTVSEWPRGTAQQNPEGFRFVTNFDDISGTVTIGLAFAVLVIASKKKRQV